MSVFLFLWSAMSVFLWFAAWMALCAFLIWVVWPWWIRRAVRKGVADWRADQWHNGMSQTGRKSCDYDPTDPGMDRGYDPSREE